MSSIHDIINAYKDGKDQYQEVLSRKTIPDFKVSEIYGKEKGEPVDTVAEGDSLEYMDFLIKEKDLSDKFQLIYVDPPFFSKSMYQASFCVTLENMKKSSPIKIDAYDDSKAGNMYEYLRMMVVRIFMMKRLLSETGCICVHLDWHAAHYVKVIMDEIFGKSNFVNEIIWTYKSGGSSKKSFSKKHDTLLLYSKSEDYKFNNQQEKSYNRDFKPYRFKGVKEFCDEKGWYTNVNMKDVWNIDMVGRTSKERTGYATQKPEKLMERIIDAFSDEGDLCGDFFAGSGSFGAVCARKGRNFIMCDSSEIAIADEITRLSRGNGFFIVEKSSDKLDDHGKALVDIQKTADMDKVILRGYCPGKRGLKKVQDEKIIRYIKEDGLCTVKNWSVDFDFDGSVHRAEKVMDGSLREFLTCRRISDAGRGSSISVMCYDVLGGSTHSVKYAKGDM